MIAHLIRPAVLAAALTLPQTGKADVYILGAGQWTCGQVLTLVPGGTPLDRGQLIGWIMGYWTAASFEKEDGLAQSLADAGGDAIVNVTLQECAAQPAGTPLFAVTQALIENTRNELASQDQ